MVEKIKNLFHKEFSGLHQAAILLGGFAIVSQVLALVRDRLFAHFFGASATLDMYFAAFRIPDLLFVSIASLVSLTVLIPFLVERLEDGHAAARKFIDTTFTAFFAAITVTALIVYAALPYLTAVFFPGFTETQQGTVVTMSRIMLLSPILLGVSNLFGSITQVYHRFFVYALSPVFYNMGIIVGVLVFAQWWGPVGLAWGVILGAVLHFSIQVPVVMRHRMMPRFTFNVDWREVKRVVTLSLPRTLGLSAKHITLLALIGIASLFIEGSITVFNLSFNLQSVPLSIIGVSYSVAAFPTLARLFSDNRVVEFSRNILTAARHIIFWSLPVMALFIVLRAQIVRTVFGSGAFDWADTRLTAAALALFVASLVAQGLELLLVRGYYAAGRTAIPVVTNVVTAIGIIALAFGLTQLFQSVAVVQYFFEDLLRVEGISGTAVLMLPLAFTIGMIVNAGVLFVLFQRRFGAASVPLGRPFRQSFSAAVIMGVTAYELLHVLAPVLDLSSVAGIFLQGAFAGVGGILVGILVLRLMRNPELEELIRSLKSRFWRTETVAPEQEEL